MAEALVQVVNERDEPVASATKQELWSQGLLHRIVRIIIEDENGRILLQKRAAHKYPHPNCWDASAAGHVDDGEEYEEAALRELKEELGLIGAVLMPLGQYRTNRQVDGRKLNRFNMVYKMTLEDPQQVVPDDDEVAEVRWFSLEEVKALIKEHPDTTTNGLKEAIKRYY